MKDNHLQIVSEIQDEIKKLKTKLIDLEKKYIKFSEMSDEQFEEYDNLRRQEAKAWLKSLSIKD